MVKPTSVFFFALIIFVVVSASGCQSAADSVNKTDQWIDQELHKHM